MRESLGVKESLPGERVVDDAEESWPELLGSTAEIGRSTWGFIFHEFADLRTGFAAGAGAVAAGSGMMTAPGG